MTFDRFASDESGAITIEWVALAAGVVLISISVIIALRPGVDAAALAVGSGLDSRVTSQIGAGG